MYLLIIKLLFIVTTVSMTLTYTIIAPEGNYGLKAAIYVLGAGTMFSVSLIPRSGGARLSPKLLTVEDIVGILTVSMIVVFTWQSGLNWISDSTEGGGQSYKWAATVFLVISQLSLGILGWKTGVLSRTR